MDSIDEYVYFAKRSPLTRTLVTSRRPRNHGHCDYALSMHALSNEVFATAWSQFRLIPLIPTAGQVPTQ
jgi:hypothetical protein